MAVEDELRLDFQGEDSSMSSTAAKVVKEIDTLDNSINKLINSFNTFSQVSSGAGNDLSHFIQSTNGLEEIGDKINKMSESFNNLNPAIENLSNSFNDFNSASDSVANLKQKIESKKVAIENDTRATEEAKKKADNLKNSNKSLSQSFTEIGTAVVAVYGVLKKWTLQAADATRAQTRFNAVFDKSNGELAEARKWVEYYSNALYLDNIEVENAISKFRVLTNSMGMNNAKSKEMSFNMTQLAYDLKAVSGNDISQTVNQLTSALNGQTKALAEYGIAIDSNTMQQYLNAHGIDRKVSSLTAAQRAEVRYMQIMESSAGIQGYYAKTLMSPSNALNIIKTQFSLLAREIGNVFIPILMALVPVVITVTKALRSLAKALASFFGIDINFDDYSEGLSLMSDGIGDIGDSADSTSKKVRNMLRDFDDLHVVDFGDDSSGSGGGAGGLGGGIGGGESLFDPVEYADWSKYLTDIKNKFKDWLPLIIAIGAAFAAWKIIEIIDRIKAFVKALDNNPLTMFLLGIIGIVDGFILFKKGIDDMIDGNMSLNSVLKVVIGTLILFFGTLAVLRAASKWKLFGLNALGLNQLAVLALGATLIITGLYIAIASLAKIMDVGREASKLWLVVLGGLSLVMIGLTIAGAPVLAAILGIAFGVFYLAGLLVELKTRIQNLFNPTVEVIDAFDWMSDKAKNLKDSIKNFTSETTTNYEDMTGNILENNNKMDYSTKLFKDNINGYLDDDMRKTLGMSQTEWEEYKNSLVDVQSNLTMNSEKNLSDIQKNIANTDDVFGEKTNSMSKAMDDFGENIDSNGKIIDDVMKDNIKATEDFEKSYTKSMENANNIDVKAPQFSWTVNAANFISGALKTALSLLGLPGILPKMMIDWVSVRKFAEGGFPEKGQLFIANEREPELIGNMGNRSVVANNAQITEGIAQASYGAFKQALSEMGNNFGGDTVVYVGDTQITDVITKKKRIQDKRFGR